jgi:hypothetical protein
VLAAADGVSQLRARGHARQKSARERVTGARRVSGGRGYAGESSDRAVRRHHDAAGAVLDHHERDRFVQPPGRGLRFQVVGQHGGLVAVGEQDVGAGHDVEEPPRPRKRANGAADAASTLSRAAPARVPLQCGLAGGARPGSKST